MNFEALHRIIKRYLKYKREIEIDDILIEGAKHRVNQFYSRN